MASKPSPLSSVTSPSTHRPPFPTPPVQGVATAVFGGLGGGLGGLVGGVMLDLHMGWPATWCGAAGGVAALWGLSAALPAASRVVHAVRGMGSGAVGAGGFLRAGRAGGSGGGRKGAGRARGGAKRGKAGE